MFQSTVAPSADWALAVATQEATDKDSNALRGKTAHESAVAIRKPAGAGNGYRLRDRRIGGVRIAPSLKGEVTEKDFIGFAVLSNSLFP